jgi:hypothetical protein
LLLRCFPNLFEYFLDDILGLMDAPCDAQGEAVEFMPDRKYLFVENSPIHIVSKWMLFPSV